jgi:hypothetical protein
MITKPNFLRFHNNELVQFLNDSLTVCKQQNIDQLNLTKQVGNLDTKTAAINAVFKIEKGSSITEKVVALDKRRDGNIIGIRTYAEGLTYHFDSSIQEAAKTILYSIDKYGKNLYLLNYQAETSTINKLIYDWTNDNKLVEALAKLNLTDWAKELKSSNDLFNETFLQRVGEKSTVEGVKFAELRKASIVSFRDLVKHIEARATLAPDASYEVIIKPFNALIEKYNRLVANRSTIDEKPVAAKS